MKKVIEVTARGFDGATDDTDNRVLWIKANSAADVVRKLDGLSVPYQSVIETDIAPSDAHGDCVKFSKMVALLFDFVVADMRAAMESAELALAQYEHDDSNIGQEIAEVLKTMRAAQEVSV